MSTRLLYVPLSPEALEEIDRRARLERRRPQDEAAVVIERALGLAGHPQSDTELPHPPSEEVGP